jgi:hypothetical protein
MISEEIKKIIAEEHRIAKVIENGTNTYAELSSLNRLFDMFILRLKSDDYECSIELRALIRTAMRFGSMGHNMRRIGLRTTME